jgi:hypothetical protein
MGEIRNAYRNQPQNLNGKDQDEEIGVDGRIILKFMLEK